MEVCPPTEADADAYREAVTMSAKRLSDFSIPDPDNFAAILSSQSSGYRTFMMWARDPGDGHGLVGRVNVANVIAGAFRSANLGYDAYDPYAGRGLFAEGLSLAVDLAFADPPEGMGLHRLEANIQPANTRSAGMIRSLGFVHEGFSRDFLLMPGTDGRRAWRDHDRYTMLATDWPAVPYRPHPRRRLVVVVNGPLGFAGADFAQHLAQELSVPLYSTRVVEQASVLFELLRASPVGGVVECKLSPTEVRMGIARIRLDPNVVPVIDPVGTADKHDVTAHALRVRATYG